jgi:archaellum biogenesis protein FlaJ (TadC family)
MKIYAETYVSMMFFTAVLTLPVSIAAIVLLYFTKLILLILLVPTPIYVMIGFLVMPMSRASERATVLEREVPFAATYVTVMASGGIPPYMSFKRLAKVELLPATRKEAKEIIKDVEIFGIDPLSAMEKAGAKNPLDIFLKLCFFHVRMIFIDIFSQDVPPPLHILKNLFIHWTAQAIQLFRKEGSVQQAGFDRLFR